MLKNLLLTLAEPGSEGGTGGGGPSAAPVSGLPPLPSASSRERIYDASDAKAAPETPPAGAGETETPPAKDSEKPPADKGKGKEADAEGTKADPEKRIKDTQAAYHKTREDLAAEKKAREESDRKLALAAKYVDFDKLAEHDKTQTEAELDTPVTKRELKVKEDAEAKAKADADRLRIDAAEKEATDAFVAKFVKDHPHVKVHLDSGAAKGVWEVEATRIWNESPDLSKAELMEKAALAVSDHFRKQDEANRKQIAKELTTRRESLDQGRTPLSGGQPGGGSEEEDVTDNPQAEFARRNAVRSRTLRPTL